MKIIVKQITIVFAFMMFMTSVANAYGVQSGKENTDANNYIEQQILGKKYPGGVAPLPYFFNVPKSAHLKLGYNFDSQDVVFDYFHSLTKNNKKKNQIGLRLVMVNDSQSRIVTAKNLAASGLVENGDVILTFHPEWGGTGPYPNLMTGISHAGMAFIHDGKVQNIDMPLNEEQNFQEGTNNRSYLNSDHYINHAPFIHILRPRISNSERENLSKWAEAFYERNRGSTSGETAAYPYPLRFNSNYLNPAYLLHKDLGDSRKNLTAHVLDVGRAGGGERNLQNYYLNVDTGQPSKTLPLFCSDFVWSLHALRGCYVNNMSRCRPDPLFKPIGLIGKGQGANYTPGSTDAALIVMQAMGERDPAKLNQMIESVFDKKFDYLNISSGHKKAAGQIDGQLYKALSMYWKAKLSGDPRAPQIAAEINEAGMPDNYAPTSFLINALLPNNNRVKKYDYVATVAFVGNRDYRAFKSKLSGGMKYRGFPQSSQAAKLEPFDVKACMSGGEDYEEFLVGLLKQNDVNANKYSSQSVRELRCGCKDADLNGKEIDVCQRAKSIHAKHGLSWAKFISPK